MARQKAILTELERDGHNTEDAKMLLSAIEKSLSTQIAIRNRLRGDLDQP